MDFSATIPIIDKSPIAPNFLFAPAPGNSGLSESFIKPMIKDGEVYDNLLSFQLSVVKRPFENGRDFECGYDFVSYFRHIGADKETKLRK